MTDHLVENTSVLQNFLITYMLPELSSLVQAIYFLLIEYNSFRASSEIQTEFTRNLYCYCFVSSFAVASAAVWSKDRQKEIKVKSLNSEFPCV